MAAIVPAWPNPIWLFVVIFITSFSIGLQFRAEVFQIPQQRQALPVSGNIMRHLLIITTFFLASTKTFAYNLFWTHTDKKFISAVINLDKNNPKEIEQYFKNQRIQKCDTTKEVLGFGWSMWTPGIGGGYVSISAQFLYYHDSLVSYSLTPRLPDEKGLQKRYKKWFGNYFDYSNSEIHPIKFNEQAILKPLKEYSSTLPQTSKNISDYMSPNSGTMYGYRGGYPFNILENRQAFIAIEDSLNTKDIELIMYSINPASRLTAIEYYFKFKGKFSNQEMIDQWIERVINERPLTTTMFGCSKENIDTKILLLMMSKTTDKYYR